MIQRYLSAAGRRGRGMVFTLLAAAFLCVSLVAARPAPSAAAPLEDVAVQFHWLHQFEFAGFYVAREKGFYTDAGLNVTILPFEKGKTDVVDAVMSGKAQYGVGYSSLVFDYLSGKPVTALAAIYQDSPLVLITRDDPDLKTPEDLRGRNVMIGGDALNSAPIMALLFSHGLLRTDITRQDHSYDIGDLISGRTDAMTAYVSNEPFHMRERGHGFRVFDPKEAGLSFYGNILFTSEAEVRDNPDRTRRFVEASLRGWRYAFDNIDEAIRLVEARYNEQNKSHEGLAYEANALRKLALKKGVPIGDLDLHKLEKAADAYRLMGIKMSARPLDAFVWEGARKRAARRPVFSATEEAFIRDTVVEAATTTNWPPFSFVDAQTGQPLGIGHDFWQYIVETAGLRSRITPFASFLKELESVREKTRDVIYSVGITEDRKQYALFTEPYASFPLAIATSKDENFIPDPSYLEGRKIAVGRNFTAHKMMAKAFPDLDYFPARNVIEGLDAVSRGDAYAFVDIMPVLAHSISRYGFTNLKISGDTGLRFDLRIMVRDDYPELVAIADKVIAGMRPETKQEILNRWVNVQYQKGFDYSVYIPYAIAVLILASVVFLWMYNAKRRAERAEAALTVKSNALEISNAELQQAMKRLEQSNTELQSFAYVASHDLREPLRMISSYLQLLSRKYEARLDGEALEYIGYAVGGAKRMNVLIRDLLQYSQVQTHGETFADVDAEEVLEAAIDNLDAVIAEAGAIVTFRDLPMVHADRSLLLQLFQNLVANAVKYRSPDTIPEIDVGATVDDGTVMFSVRDNGIGIEKQYFERIFVIFQRLHGREEYSGTGIGLAICKKIVEHHGGRIWVHSAPGEGTTFHFTMPEAKG